MDPQPCAPEAYKARPAVERGLGWLKGRRRVDTRYDPYALATRGFCTGRTLDLAEPKYPRSLTGSLLELPSDHPLPVCIQMPPWAGKMRMPIFLISLLITYRKMVASMRHPV